MNFRYVRNPEADALKAAVAANPHASLSEIQRSHPRLRARSLDHLSLLFAQLPRTRDVSRAK